MSQSTTNSARRSQLLDGAAVAAQIKLETAREVERLWKAHQVKPCLAAVLVGNDPASAVYVRNKIRACEEVGIRSEHHALPARTDSIELLDLIASLNKQNHRSNRSTKGRRRLSSPKRRTISTGQAGICALYAGRCD